MVACGLLLLSLSNDAQAQPRSLSESSLKKVYDGLITKQKEIKDKKDSLQNPALPKEKKEALQKEINLLSLGMPIESSSFSQRKGINVESADVMSPPDVFTSIAYGVTDFLISRARSEILYSFVVELKDKFQNIKLLQTLFPKFYLFLTQVELLQFSAILTALKEAVIQDFDNLPRVILNYKDSLKVEVGTGNDAVALDLFCSSLVLVSDIKSGTSPALVISNQARLLANIVKNDTAKHWLKFLDFAAKEAYYFNAEVQSQTLGSIVFSTPELRKEFVDKFIAAIKATEPSFKLDSLKQEEIILWIERLAQLQKQFESLGESDGKDKAKIDAYIESFTQVLLSSLQVFNLNQPAQPYTKMVRTAGDFTKAVLHQNYPRALINLVGVIEASNSSDSTLKSAIRFLTFISNLAAAKNEKEVEDILESAAAPVGSFRAKRQGNLMFSISSYLGISGGLETSSGNLPSGNLGFFLPVGIECTFLSSKTCSIGINATVLDFGTLANYRLGGTENPNPKVTVAQIFAPGAFFVFGFTDNYPIALGIGARYVPRFRDSLNGENVWQVNAFFAVDLTLFKF
jgi:hypothetical protein